uniref:tyrosyl-DNA phosphodiesterase 1-like n=1 Tax=Styela clava TaxID=7725 RepID=UPI001939C075|nr:tyrosyl-DNA phosphodiesterase 1-like [Styela clava]
MSSVESGSGWALSDDDSEGSDSASLLPQRKRSRKDDSIQQYRSPANIQKKRTAETRNTDSKKVCPYADKCYRKNPAHFKEFSHSGNSNKKVDSKKDSEILNKKQKLHTKQKVIENVRDPQIIWHKSSPLNFMLSRVSGIPPQYNYYNESSLLCSIHISDILSKNFGDLIETVQFNYCIDVKWFLQQLPTEKRNIPILFVHGKDGADYSEVDRVEYKNIKTCRVDLPPFGTHHTKMMFLKYKEGIRIVIHTANLVERDWFQKTQGIWVSPLFIECQSSSKIEKSTFSFKHDMLEYLKEYKKHPDLTKWIDLINSHDLSTANVILIGSVPGRHKDSMFRKWGHLKLAKVLNSYVESSFVNEWPVIGQFSSIGSLGNDKDKWMCKEWLKSLSSTKPQRFGSLNAPSKKATLKLIFPTVDNVRTSLEGYPAGASLPYSFAVAKKQLWLNNFLHQWKADNVGRSCASPHIKTYTRVSKDYKQAAWFLVTSANLSKAAWGALEKKDTQLAIRSYELGVLFIPERFFPESGKKTFQLVETCEAKADITLPFSTPLVQYSEKDEPWIWNIPHKHLPDRNGNMWVPS